MPLYEPPQRSDEDFICFLFWQQLSPTPLHTISHHFKQASLANSHLQQRDFKDTGQRSLDQHSTETLGL